jgi:hypothetical protein
MAYNLAESTAWNAQASFANTGAADESRFSARYQPQAYWTLAQSQR